jgi:hypothetical protein
MLKAKLLLSGVKETSNVLAPIPLFSIHVARDCDPMTLMATVECISDSRTNVNARREEKESPEPFGVRFGCENRIVSIFCFQEAVTSWYPVFFVEEG